MMNLKLKEEQNEEGFTLIELLVVVIIIGILAAIAIPVFLNQREAGWQGSVDSDVRNAAIAAETCMTRMDGDYPSATDVSGTEQLCDPAGGTPVMVSTSTGVTLQITGGETSFEITGVHDRLDAADTPHATYNSATGGLEE